MTTRVRLLIAGLSIAAAVATGTTLTTNLAPVDTTWGSHATTNDTTWGTPAGGGDGGGQEPPANPGDTTWG